MFLFILRMVHAVDSNSAERHFNHRVSEEGMGEKRRIIFHVDMDYFFAAVEEREHPEFRGKPIIVGADPKIGMVFQKPNPFPMMSIYDNVAAGLKLNGVRDKKILEAAVRRSLELANLWDEVKEDLGKSGASLSGGQQQRLCIARALAVEPEVLLMDEPCSALDPIATAKIEALIRKLAENYTVIIVTHNMQQAARVSDYTAFLYLGELIEYGPTKRIFENPKHELTERYLTGEFG